MRDEELKRLGERLDWIARRAPETQARAYKAIEELRRVTEVADQQQEAWDEAVGAELVRLEAENAALREIVEKVALVNFGHVYAEFCPFCEKAFYEGEPDQHAEDCPITKARALLGKPDVE